jgi:hypothetical protein
VLEFCSIILQLPLPDLPDVSNMGGQETSIKILSWLVVSILTISVAVIMALWIKMGNKEEQIQKLNDRNYEILATTNTALTRVTDLLTMVNVSNQTLPSEVRSEITKVEGIIKEQHESTRKAFENFKCKGNANN